MKIAFREVDALVRDEAGRMLQKQGRLIDVEDLVAVICYHPSSDQLVFVQQFRPASASIRLGEGSLIDLELEVVAGSLISGVDPETVARNEVHEETGCQIAHLSLALHYFNNPALLTSKTYLYAAILRDVPEIGVERGNAAEEEKIIPKAISASEVEAMYFGGKITNAMTLVAVSWFLLSREHFRMSAEATKGFAV